MMRDLLSPLVIPRGLAGVGLMVCLLAAWAEARVSPDFCDDSRVGSGESLAKQEPEFDVKAACGEVVDAHNRLRAEARLPALEVSPRLQAAAQRHAKDMAAREEMTHRGGDGSSPIARIKATGYPYRRAGENIAAGTFTTTRLMKGWMDSPHHKRNILGSYSQIGVACVTGESGKRYWCVTFGLPIRR